MLEKGGKRGNNESSERLRIRMVNGCEWKGRLLADLKKRAKILKGKQSIAFERSPRNAKSLAYWKKMERGKKSRCLNTATLQ